MANIISSMGVIANEVKERTTQKGNYLVECFAFFNDYVPGVGKTQLEVQVTVWGEKAKWLYAEAQKHKNKQGNLTKGKGMPMFFIGYLYTNKFTGQNGEVKETRMQAVDVLYREAPLFNCTGVIGSEVKADTFSSSGKTFTKAQFPVYFNGFIPKMGNSAFEGYVTAWDDIAKRIEKLAKEHTNKNNELTNGRGMALDFVCYVNTSKYQKDGEEKRNTQLTVVDFKFPQNVFNSNSNSNADTSNSSASTNSSRQEQKEPVEVGAPAPTEQNSEALDFNDMNADVDLSNESLMDEFEELFKFDGSLDN